MRSVIFLTCFCAAGAIFAQTGQPIDRPSAQEALGSPSFTDKDRYNSYDFCGSPLGIFKKDSVRVRLDLGMRGTWWHERDHGDSLKRSALAWNLPDLLIGKPGIMYVRINYTPTSISDNTRALVSSLPDKRLREYSKWRCEAKDTMATRRLREVKTPGSSWGWRI